MKFSIITINFNNKSGIIKTIESVVKQNFNDFEFIVIDGCSSDGSVEYIIENSNFFSYWVSEKDNGVYHAMNKGLKIAKGEYCIFLNSGDYFFDTNVLLQVSNSILNNSVLVYGLIEWENQKILWNPRRDLKDFEMAFESLIPHQACFFKTDVIKTMGGYQEKYKVISDWGLMLQLITHKFEIQKIDMLVSMCEKQGISSSLEHKIIKERIDFLFRYSFSTLIKGCLFKMKKFLFN